MTVIIFQGNLLGGYCQIGSPEIPVAEPMQALFININPNQRRRKTYE
jgi:hypothetical protein